MRVKINRIKNIIIKNTITDFVKTNWSEISLNYNIVFLKKSIVCGAPARI